MVCKHCKAPGAAAHLLFVLSHLSPSRLSGRGAKKYKSMQKGELKQLLANKIAFGNLATCAKYFRVQDFDFSDGRRMCCAG